MVLTVMMVTILLRVISVDSVRMFRYIHFNSLQFNRLVNNVRIAANNFLLTMITICGKNQPSIVDAAKEFGVAAKTVRDWIGKRVIPPPPVMQFGIRRVQVFPPDYMKIAKQKLEAYTAKKENLRRKHVSLIA